MFPIQESGACTSSEQHRGADPLYGDIDPPYWDICVSPEIMTWGGAVPTTFLSCGGMDWRKMLPPFTLHPSLPITDEGANLPPYQLQHSGKQALLFNLGSSVELKLLTGVQGNRP